MKEAQMVLKVPKGAQVVVLMRDADANRRRRRARESGKPRANHLAVRRNYGSRGPNLGVQASLRYSEAVQTWKPRQQTTEDETRDDGRRRRRDINRRSDGIDSGEACPCRPPP